MQWNNIITSGDFTHCLVRRQKNLIGSQNGFPGQKSGKNPLLICTHQESSRDRTEKRAGNKVACIKNLHSPSPLEDNKEASMLHLACRIGCVGKVPAFSSGGSRFCSGSRLLVRVIGGIRSYCKILLSEWPAQPALRRYFPLASPCCMPT